MRIMGLCTLLQQTESSLFIDVMSMNAATVTYVYMYVCTYIHK